MLTYPELQQVANHLVEVVDPDRADELVEDRLRAEEARAWQAIEHTIDGVESPLPFVPPALKMGPGGQR